MKNENIINEELHSAVRTGKYEAVVKLLNEGANVNYNDKFKNNALFYAVVHCRKEIVTFLLDRGADINSVYQEKKSILHVAVESDCEEKGFFEITNLLVDAGANINFQDEYGNTPLGYACTYYVVNMATIELLLQNGADMDIKNNYGMSDYNSAKENNRVELLEILTKYRSK